MNNLSVDGEFRYIVSWFNEWSELQREDFVPVMVEYLTHDTTPGAVYMNGIVHSVAQAGLAEKPMSLFQCRIKLFREWSPKWPLEFKHKLKEKIIEIDTKVGEKIINDIKGPNGSCSPIETPNGQQLLESQSHTNGHDEGYVNGNGMTTADATIPPITISTITATNTDNNSLAMLPNNELSVDNDVEDSDTVAVAVEAGTVAVDDTFVEPAEQVNNDI